MKSLRPCLLLGALFAALFFTGCATVTRGVHESLVIESDPSGAKVTLSTGETGSTPTSFRIKRKGAVVVTVAKEGYETVTINVTTQVAAAGAAGMAGNVLVGGIIGAGVDAFSGGMLEHKPNPVKVTMVALKVAPAAVAEAKPAEVRPAAPVAPAAATPAEAKPVEAAAPVAPVATPPVEAKPAEKTAETTTPAATTPNGMP